MAVAAVAAVGAKPSGSVGLSKLGRRTKRKDSVFTRAPLVCQLLGLVSLITPFSSVSVLV